MFSKAHGFTLIEVMVALLLMAILSVLSWRALDAMSRTRDTLNSHGQQDDQLKALFNLWEKDCHQLVMGADGVLTVPVYMDSSETVLLKEKTLANGVHRPIVVIYELENNQLIRLESRGLNTRQELMRVWSNALNHHLTTDLGLLNREVLLESVDALSSSTFFDGMGWVNNSNQFNAAITSQKHPREVILRALELSVLLTHQSEPFHKIALTGVD
ncbi:MAG: prepilin-type cleavage/methylation domain-containing protein [Ferrovum sp. 37-45-19]|jgi:general secretion pathway protein J|uniref:PulJ/GspJ family protein n=1 Tax=Ferrovum sp. JA12 TaxID=1356299 RepID=UPI000703982E|nr:prepilin-type N-terminal cleavage/methylation domain-containing protein [Ferrovum sp. JA12]OYV79966.1 MAG: prepilin-type cleavage/methylation domain-containing protein [Ferrovum sp. 21-44-67]OYV94083.1 MAG: prepilin-type cleavage/methylation domain-containing protein [Ferrovum sp. 37-45-19]OZB33973.1 MAG: prepilin-type cleavage/methylation domain-containing protein [Ferrovum sp. 34-44-207]HQT82095.1 prepilin-type N-terminal cleavage/methylation domain-containing protein [Ferrovaceae bacteriu